MTSLLCAFAIHLLLRQDAAEVRVLEPVQYHGEEIDAQDGETWWGLFQSDSGAELREVTINVETVIDEIVDAEGEMTGKQVSAGGPDQPYLMVRDIELAAGPVLTAHLGDAFVNAGETIALELPGDASGDDSSASEVCELTAIGTAVETEYDRVYRPYALTLTTAGPAGTLRSEIVALEEVSAEGAPQLLWAGDLDRDGHIDLLMNLTDHYNVRALTLFLSTRAKPDESVGKAAELITTGC